MIILNWLTAHYDTGDKNCKNNSCQPHMYVNIGNCIYRYKTHQSVCRDMVLSGTSLCVPLRDSSSILHTRSPPGDTSPWQTHSCSRGQHDHQDESLLGNRLPPFLTVPRRGTPLRDNSVSLDRQSGPSRHDLELAAPSHNLVRLVGI